MARAQSLLKGWFAGSHEAEQASSTTISPRPLASIEALEDRRLLSATGVNPGGAIITSPTPTPPVMVGAKGYGVTLNLKAGQAFNGYLGDLVDVKVPTGFTVGASVNWGDGTQAKAGVVSITSAGNIDVSGSHTYARGGKYAISITVTAIPAVTGPVTEPIILYVGGIQSRAFVNSSGGVAIDEKAGVAFTATVGTFSYIAPATNLHASINWGDGTPSSVGTITSTGVTGIDVINFKVDGSHKYARKGTYAIVVTVSQTSTSPGSPTLVRLITTIDSTAIVAAPGLNLDGKITGVFTPAPTAVTIGALYIFNDGTGHAGVLGPVFASGRIQLPPFFGTGPVTGGMTLASIGAGPAGPGGTVTLKLTGPVEKGSGPIPATLSYVIISGTGDFASASGSGTIDVSLIPNTLEFTFVIHSK